MKYMGSKRWMLKNGLGDALRQEAKGQHRVVDLFCGSASVSWFATQVLEKPVLAVDIQSYSAVLARSVIEREESLDSNALQKKWLETASRLKISSKLWKQADKIDQARANAGTWSKKARLLCSKNSRSTGTIWRAYGGYYFSPTQALTFEAMLQSLPKNKLEKAVCLAAIIISASKCAASPGHTAQPFRATRTAGKFLREAWMREPIEYAKKALDELCPQYARKKGLAKICDANNAISYIKETDLVFIDPPYSGVHYSRFYHVLETIARGKCGDVSGAGRYPPPKERPVSKYSQKSESKNAMKTLLEGVAKAKAKAILTFPFEKCSNGLSGKEIESMARKLFIVNKKLVNSRFSTLGGNNTQRKARKHLKEMILILHPK